MIGGFRRCGNQRGLGLACAGGDGFGGRGAGKRQRTLHVGGERLDLARGLRGRVDQRNLGFTCAGRDGFGPPGSKIDDYRIFDNRQLIQYPGFKLFYGLDKPLMSPADVLNLNPAPLMVMYQ